MDWSPRSDATFREALAERVGAEKFGLWFGEGVRLGVEGDALTVGVPNGFFREWIRGHYADDLLGVGELVSGRPLRLDVRVDAGSIRGEAEPKFGDVVDPSPGKGRQPAPMVTVPKPSPGPPPATDRPTGQGRPPRSLAAFVVGPGSRFAHAAAVEMVESGGSAYNPLVIHGGVGLGKTHLLEGIGAALRSRRPGARVIHTTAEAFTNGFLDAMRAGSLGGFRAKYRGAAALIVDDVHFLAAKRATQVEFQHTFDALMADGVPVVLAADQHPRQVARLTDELTTRFLGGMVVKLEAPDPVARRAILRAKAQARGVDVPDAVLAYIADHLRASVRELEGALNSVLAHATLAGRRIDLDLAKGALRETIRHTAQAVALKDVERAVCQLFGLDAESLRSNSRAHAVTHPRMLAMYLARKHTGAPFSEIGRFFGGRNHSTVISAEKKVAGWLTEERRQTLLAGFESVADVLAALERSIGA